MKDRIISGRYKIEHKIGEGGTSVVYLGHDTKNNKRKVAVKMLRKNRISRRIEDIIRFRNEAGTVSKLNNPNIIKVYEIDEFEDSHYIVMEYIDGKSLQNIMKEGNDYNLNKILDIITQISDTLGYIHNAGMVHRDLKPSNIMINEKKETKLIDFGLAQIKEFSKIKSTETIVGTFSYMSPEQCGVIKRTIDERSDLYSLGIIFYQLLTDQLPFNGNSISSIIHQHIAKTPESPRKRRKDIPEVLGKIMLKLIEKDPEKRYQSARGLLNDLAKYKKGERNFVLGLKDKLVKLSYRTILIGRDEELNQLKTIFNDALNGKGSVCLIDGQAGRGKTRLVEELQDYVYAKDGSIISGKCFSGDNKMPYGVFKETLNVYITKYNNYSEKKRSEVKEKIKKGLGELGMIILNLNPIMKEIIGECPPLVELEPDRENKRFLMVVSRFFQELALIEDGLVFILEDLQWSDEAGHKLMMEITQNISGFPLLIIGTYRNNEVNKAHELKKYIEISKENELPLHEIHIDLFDKKKMNQFISHLLHENEENTTEISDFILQKSKGNPFFATEVLKQLINENALFYKDSNWNINHKILDKMEISSSILEIVLKRISLLNKKEINILSYAAVIGRRFDIKLLFKLTEFKKQEIIEIIDKSIKLQLLKEDLQEKGKMLFVHDKIKEAFYSNIEKVKLKKLNLEIAKTIEKMNKDTIEDVIFDLAYHYIEAADKENTLQYAYSAGIKAKEGYANEEALKYFSIGRDILEEQGQKSQDRWLEFMEEIGDVYLIIGKNDEAIKISMQILPFMKTKFRKAAIYKKISEAYFKKADWENCEKYGKIGLKLLGEKLPVKKVSVIFGIIKQLITHILHNFLPIIFIRKKPNPQSKKYKLIIWFYIILEWSYILSDISKFIRSVLRMINLSESKIGMSKELGMSIGAYASVCMAIPLFKSAVKNHEKAISLRTKLNDEWGVAQSLQFLGFCYEWQGEYEKGNEYFKKSIHIFNKIGDTREIGMSTVGLVHNYYYLSSYDKAKITTDQYFKIVDHAKNNYGISDYYINMARCNLEAGDHEKALKNALKSYTLSNEKNIWFIHCVASIELGIQFLEKGDIKRALEYLEEADSLYSKNNFLKQYTIHLFPYLTECYIEQYKINKKKKDLAKIKKSCKISLSITKSWNTHYCIAVRVSAKYYALIGNIKKAEKLLSQSIELCLKFDRKYELAKSLYEYALFLDQINRKKESNNKLQSAYRIFKELDAKVYLKRTANLLGVKDNETSSTQRLMDKQRLSTIIKLSQDISFILNIDNLLDDVMTKAIEVTGAQRGYLFLVNENTKQLEMKALRTIKNEKVNKFSRHIVEDVFKSGDTLITTNAGHDERFKEYKSIKIYGLKSILCIPIKHHKKIVGVCYLDNSLSNGVFTDEDADLLGVFTSQAAIAIENASLYKNLELKVKDRTLELSESMRELAHRTTELIESKKKIEIEHELLKKKNDIMEDDLKIARKIQMQFIPSQSPAPNIAFYYKPMTQVGGDYFHFVQLDLDNIGIFISDVSGHGVPAAFITSMIHSLLLQFGNLYSEPCELLLLLNESLIGQTAGNFITAFYGIYNPKIREFTYSNAGHNCPFILSDKYPAMIDSKKAGLPLAILDNLGLKDMGKSYNNETIKLDKNSKLLFYTDGLTEAVNINDKKNLPESWIENFETSQLITEFDKCKNITCAKLVENMVEKLVAFRGDNDFDDDVCMICLDLKEKE